MSAKYGSNPNIMYEPWNEPTVAWATVKTYHEAVIAAIRANDPDNIIFLGTPQWDQKPDTAAADPVTTSTNLAYVVHFYANSHPLAGFQKAITTTLNAGLAIFVTEYGGCSANGKRHLQCDGIAEMVDLPGCERHRLHELGSRDQWRDVLHLQDQREREWPVDHGRSHRPGWHNDYYLHTEQVRRDPNVTLTAASCTRSRPAHHPGQHWIGRPRGRGLPLHPRPLFVALPDNHGAYSKLAPAAKSEWTVRWFLRKLEAGPWSTDSHPGSKARGLAYDKATGSRPKAAQRGAISRNRSATCRQTLISTNAPRALTKIRGNVSGSGSPVVPRRLKGD